MRQRKFRAMMDKPARGHDGIWVYSTNLNHWSSSNGTYYGGIKSETITEFVCLIKGTECFVGDKIQLRTGQVETVRFDEQKCMYRPFQNQTWRTEGKIVGNIFEKQFTNE